MHAQQFFSFLSNAKNIALHPKLCKQLKEEKKLLTWLLEKVYIFTHSQKELMKLKTFDSEGESSKSRRVSTLLNELVR